MKKFLIPAAAVLTVVSTFAFQPVSVTAKETSSKNGAIALMEAEASTFHSSHKVFADKFSEWRRDWTDDKDVPAPPKAELQNQILNNF